MAGFQEIDAVELKQMLAQPALRLVDVRNDDEVARGMIAGAEHLPLHLLPMRFEELNGDVPIVFYCHAGVRSAQACAFLANKGRENLYSLRGGVMAWANAGFALDQKK